MKTYKQVMVGFAAVAAMVGSAQAVVVNWEITGAPGAISTSAGTVTVNNYTSSTDIPADGLPHTFDFQPFVFTSSSSWAGTPSVAQTYTEQVKVGVTTLAGQNYTENFTIAYSVDNGDVLTFLNTGGASGSFTSGGYTLTLAPKSSQYNVDPNSTIGLAHQQFILAKLTVVPEPYQYGLVSMFGLFGLAAFDRIRQRRLVG